MMTLRRFQNGVESVPASVAWLLADLAEARGRQELFTRQAPQKLKVLREHALIESTVSSNRIEGVEVEQSRVATLVFGRPALRDRSEEELQGYCDALKLVHERAEELTVDEATILRLHRLSRGQIWDAGIFKEPDGEIVEILPEGGRRVRFFPLAAAATPDAVRETCALWRECVKDRGVHQLIALAAFNLDFLCIHPFRDGNGRVSRLLLLLQLYHLGFEVGRYISLEKIIEEEKERYYETLQMCSKGWHEGNHDPWPYVGFLLFVVRSACRRLEERVGQVASPRGAKTELVTAAIRGFAGEFTLAQLERACPGVSRDMIRRVLRDLARAEAVRCVGRGPGARWRRLEKG